MKRIFNLLLLIPLLQGCYKEGQPAISDIIVRLYAPQLNWPADGVTQVPVTADLPGNTLPGNYNVGFSTNKSLFFDSQKSATTILSEQPLPDSAFRSATALLVAPADTGVVVVTASSQDIFRSITLHFVQAIPQSVKLSTSTQFVTTTVTSEATLTLALQRSKGIATAGQVAVITATDTLGNTVGNFRNGNQVLSDKTGNATFYFSANQSSYLGKVNIKAYIQAQPALFDTITLTIIKGN